MLKTFFKVGLASAVGVLGAALPGHAAIIGGEFLDLSACGGNLNNCVVSYNNGLGMATITVTQASSPVTGTPGSDPADGLVMGVNAQGASTPSDKQTVKINFSFPTPISLQPPALNGGTPAFGDFRDNWTATVDAGSWTLVDPGPQDLSTQYPAGTGTTVPGINPPPTPVAGAISWSHPYSLSTKRARTMVWDLTSTSQGVTMLTLEYFNSSLDTLPGGAGDPVFNNADGLRIQVIPEPLTILGAATATGFGAFFKRRLAKSQKKEG